MVYGCSSWRHCGLQQTLFSRRLFSGSALCAGGQDINRRPGTTFKVNENALNKYTRKYASNGVARALEKVRRPGTDAMPGLQEVNESF